MSSTNKISLTHSDLRYMISEAARNILKEYWTSADDAAEEDSARDPEGIPRAVMKENKRHSRMVICYPHVGH